MSYITEHKQKFEDLKLYLKNQDQLKIKANGGNTILFSYPPDEDNLYIEKAKDIYKDKAAFINISKLLVEYIKKRESVLNPTTPKITERSSRKN